MFCVTVHKLLESLLVRSIHNMNSSEVQYKFNMNMNMNLSEAGAAISREVILTGTAVPKANNPNSLSEFGGNVILADMCGRSVLKSMDWVKRKGTTGKVKPSKQLLAEEKYTFHISISKVILSMIYHQS